MNCMKCGRELKDRQAFCDGCLADMEKYPVKPGTPIQLPQRSGETAAKKRPLRRKRILTPEEQLPRLRFSVRLLMLALTVALIAFALTSLLAIHLLEERGSRIPIGQNYSVVGEDGQ